MGKFFGGIDSRLLRLTVVALAATVFPAALVVSSAGPAGAAKADAGNVSCQLSGGITTTPAISSTGTLGKKLDVTITSNLTGCEKAGDPSFPKTGKVQMKTLKLPATVVGGQKVVGKASDFAAQLGASTAKAKAEWGPGFKATKAVLKPSLKLPPDPCVGGGAACEAALQLKSISSSGGSLDATEFLDASSTQELQGLIKGTGAPASSLSFDATTSDETEGPAVLTTGSVGGANVAVGDTVFTNNVSVPGCPLESVQGVVVSNPAAPGSAEVSWMASTFSFCNLSSSVFEASQLVPFYVSIDDASGFPATISDLDYGGFLSDFGISCFYGSPSIPGAFSNSTNSVTSPNVTLVAVPDISSPQCPNPINDDVTIGPIVDQSVSGSPAIFVN